MAYDNLLFLLILFFFYRKQFLNNHLHSLLFSILYLKYHQKKDYKEKLLDVLFPLKHY